MKIAIRLVLVVFVLAAAAIGAACWYMDDLVKDGIEKVGPTVTKVDVKLKKVRLSPLSGKGRLMGFTLGNPGGFKSATSITWDEATLEVDPASFLRDEIIIKSVRIASPFITYETRLTTNNLKELMQGMTGKPATPEPAKPSKKVVVKDLLITGGRVKLASSLLGGAGATLSMPDIHLTNLGEKGSGISTPQLLSLVLGTLTETSLQVATGTLKDATKIVEKTGGAALHTAGELGKGTTEVLKKTGTGATDAVKKGLKGLGGLVK